MPVRRQTGQQWPASTQKSKQPQRQITTTESRRAPKRRGKVGAVAKGLSTPEATKQAIYDFLKSHESEFKAKKVTLKSVADQYGVHISVVKTQADRLQFNIKRGGAHTSKNRAKVARLLEKKPQPGPTAIAAKLGISRQEVHRLINSLVENPEK